MWGSSTVFEKMNMLEQQQHAQCSPTSVIDLWRVVYLQPYPYLVQVEWLFQKDPRLKEYGLVAHWNNFLMTQTLVRLLKYAVMFFYFFFSVQETLSLVWSTTLPDIRRVLANKVAVWGCAFSNRELFFIGWSSLKQNC